MELEAQDAEFEKLYECPEGCGRTFKRNALEKHIKVCKTVFVAKKDGRAGGRGASMAPTGASNPVGQEEKEANTQKWKKDSEAFSKVIKPEGESAVEQVACDICGKKYIPTALARHKPICEAKKKFQDQQQNKK